MTTQEANIKDNQLFNAQQRRSTIYFPRLRECLHNVLTGFADYITTMDIQTTADYSKLSIAYEQIIQQENNNEQAPVSISFTNSGLAFSIMKRINSSTNDRGFDFIEHEYLLLDWQTDSEVLAFLCLALNELTLQCMRPIPELYQNTKVFRNINTLDANPIFDQIAFVYALHLKMGLTSNLLKCYLQMLMLTRKTTYVSMCHALRYPTNLPQNVTDYFANNDIISEKDEYIRNEEGIFVQTDLKYYAITLLNYVGQKFSIKLRLSSSPKRELGETSKYMEIQADPEVLG